jgi:spermidine synthase
MLVICKNIMHVQSQNLLIWDASTMLDELILKWEKYDTILFDCYGSNSQIPKQLTTASFFKKTKHLLTLQWTFWINMSNFKWENERYQKIHTILKELFWKHFSLFTTNATDYSNCMWIYNLSKEYTTHDFIHNYETLVNTKKMKASTEITKDTFVDSGKKLLS